MRHRGCLSPGLWTPAQLSLTGWWRDYIGTSPLAGLASLGTSGSNNLTEATNVPGTNSLNGRVTMDFDGTNDQFAGAVESTFYSASAYTMYALLMVDAFTTADPGAAAPYSCVQILGDKAAGGADGGPTGGVAGSGGSGVFRFGHHSTTWNSTSVAINTATWYMVMARYNGTNIEVGINGTYSGSVAKGNCTAVGNTIGLGFVTGIAWLNGQVAECMTANTAFSSGEELLVKTYFNQRYALAL